MASAPIFFSGIPARTPAAAPPAKARRREATPGLAETQADTPQQRPADARGSSSRDLRAILTARAGTG